MAEPLNIPEFIRRRVERAIDDAVNPKGMSVHNGMAQVHSSDLSYMLKLIDALRADGVALPDEAQGLEALPVAYLRSITHPDWLELCDRSEPGAFPVFASHADLVRSVGSAYGVATPVKGQQ
jgi:hypothetical protein